MLLILISIIVVVVVGSVLIIYGSSDNSFLSFLSFFFGFVFLLGAGFASLFYAFCTWEWIAADSKANIINREYGTNYTREEVFYASDVIETMRMLNRKRIEVNGDIMRDKPDAK